MKNSFFDVRACETNPKWENMIKRKEELYRRDNDIRTAFERDYTRIIHSLGYRRLKHKTQVVFSPDNDHICTRIEHVIHVESISYTIAKYLGLNPELTRAIATAHDIGHSPFGHEGERILSRLSKRDIGESFWHEKNGVDLVDNIELLYDDKGFKRNMNLTYAVRDGIISHCGEIDENSLFPRDEAIDLKEYTYPNQYRPYTWEGCVVKISDKISYLGRDIEDAIILGILDENLEELYDILGSRDIVINNTVIINDLIADLCENSSIEKGLTFSDAMFKKLNAIKKFNYEKIYSSNKLKDASKYYNLILETIYETLKESYNNEEKVNSIAKDLLTDFKDWLSNYWNKERSSKNINSVVFNVDNEKDYLKAIILFISGMTDNYAIDMYNKIIKFI